MNKVLRNLIAVAAIVFIALGSVLYKYYSDKTAWEKIQSELVRLQSGLEFESVIALRSRIADTDAVLKMYTTEWRIYPPHRVERVQKAEKSLTYINFALDWQTRSSDDQPSARTLEKYPDVTTSIRRSCVADKLFISSSEVAAAFVIAGRSLLENSEYPPTSESSISLTHQFAPLDFDKEAADCRRQEITRAENATRQETAYKQAIVAQREADRRKYWSRWRYHVEIELQVPNEVCAGDVIVDDTERHTLRLVSSDLEGAPQAEFGANETMMLVSGACKEVQAQELSQRPRPQS
jgi:hypothetical protein